MNRWLRYCYVFLIYALLYAPLIVVIAYSFNTSQRSLLWQGFTWKWYFSLWHDPELLTIALHSFVLAI
ncbi:MAG: spermidine/putrescine ABC transporter permease PotC, partial [Coxiellaceae bacterium]|nr:spermidine/putrescine ABC transporter permease PotC [Coxiellaceae bacterium]